MPADIEKQSINWDGAGAGDDPQPRSYYNQIKRAEGVIVTKQHQILFFTLINDRVLDLSDESNGESALVLDPEAGTSAPWLKLYPGIYKTTVQASLMGKMRPPKPEEVVTVVNRTDGLGDDHVPVSEKRIRRFLSLGTLDVTLWGDHQDL